MEGEEFFNILRVFNFILLAFTALYGVIKFNGLAKHARFLVAYLFLILIIETIAELMAFYRFNNHKLLYAYAFTEIVCLSLMYLTLLNQKPHLNFAKKICISYLIVACSILIYECYYLIANNQITLYGKAVSNIGILIFSGSYILFKIKTEEYFYNNPLFKVNTLIFIYFSISFIVFLLFNELITIDMQYSFVIWGINNLLAMCFYWVSFNYFKNVSIVD